MNRILKRIALVGGILLVIGIICTVLGVSLGGHVNYAFDLNTHEVYVPTKETEEIVDETMDVEAFESMDVQLDSVELEIKTGETYRVSYHLPSWIKPTVEIQDNKLVIKNESKNVATFGWSFDVLGIHIGTSSTSKENRKMTITIPEDAKLADTNVYSEFGDVKVENLKSDNCDIKADSGDIILKNMNVQTAEIAAGYGDVTLEGFEGVTCAVTAESGACSLDTLQVDTLSLNADYGNVVMQKNTVKTLALAAESGNVEISDMKADNSSIDAEYGKVEVRNLTGTSCTITAQSGNCEVDTLQLDTLEVTASYGDVSMANGESKDITITAENGAIHVKNTKADTIALEDEYGNVLVEDAELNDVSIVCESGNCDLGLIGNIEDYDMDITLDAGNLEINGEEQGDKYKSVFQKEKSIIVQSEYGSVDIRIDEK